MNFFETSKFVAQEFIQSLVFIDDRAEFKEQSSNEDITNTMLIEPSPADSIEEDGIDSYEPEESQETVTEEFNASKIIDAFSERGIVASIIKPSKSLDEKLIGNVVKLSKIVDVVVLDIDIRKDNGKTANEIFTRIIEEEPRLKLIVFYSGAAKSTISDFAFKIDESLDKKKGKKIDDCIFQIGKTRIVILAKEGVGSKGIRFEDLPDKIVEEFTKISYGLISNTTLIALAVVRKNIHQLLVNLDRENDAPYLTHRAWLENPDDSTKFVNDLIVSQLQILLENHDIKKYSDLENIFNYLEEKNDSRKYKVYNSDSSKPPTELDFNKIKNLLQNGYDKSKQEVGFGKKSYKNFTKTFCFNDEDHVYLDDKFAFLTITNNLINPNKVLPILTLGTIVKKDAFNEFLLCIQPKCDSVRVYSPYNFLFLKLKRDDDKFNIIIREEKKFLRLITSADKHDLQINKFQGEEDGYVRAKNNGCNITFRDFNGNRFVWVAQLKENYALSIVHNVTHNISRVGYNNYEWLVRSEKG